MPGPLRPDPGFTTPDPCRSRKRGLPHPALFPPLLLQTPFDSESLCDRDGRLVPPADSSAPSPSWPIIERSWTVRISTRQEMISRTGCNDFFGRLGVDKYLLRILTIGGDKAAVSAAHVPPRERDVSTRASLVIRPLCRSSRTLNHPRESASFRGYASAQMASDAASTTMMTANTTSSRGLNGGPP